MKASKIIFHGLVAVGAVAVVIRNPQYFGNLFRLNPANAAIPVSQQSARSAARTAAVNRQVANVENWKRAVAPSVKKVQTEAARAREAIRSTVAFQRANGVNPNEVREWEQARVNAVDYDARRRINFALSPATTVGGGGI